MVAAVADGLARQAQPRGVASGLMGYKLLGFAVWQGGKWYMRKRLSGIRPKLVVAGLSGLVLAGILAAVAQRQAGSE